MKPRILFILKRHGYGPSYGLLNSCRFIVEALIARGMESKFIEVTDNNSIDREVSRYHPSHVIIEALWVLPEKFPVLLKLHPSVTWVVRLHSNPPFISGEGIAVDWLKRYAVVEYTRKNFFIASNSPSFIHEIEAVIGCGIVYLPNTYHVTDRIKERGQLNPNLDIGCFGAIRPLKNQFQQALSAIMFAKQIGKHLRFHINSARVEQNSEPILKNLRALFFGGNELVEHPWLHHHDFVQLVRIMDYGMQVSFSETFNIVAADFVNNEIPFVGSNAINWLPIESKADPIDSESIVRHLNGARSRFIIRKNKTHLRQFCSNSIECWVNFLDETT